MDFLAIPAPMIPILLGLIWLIAANIAAVLPSNDNHWRRAYVLIALGAPLGVWIFASYGALAALIFSACAASVLRWPLVFAWRWICRVFG